MDQWKRSSFCKADQPMCVEIERRPGHGASLRDADGDVVDYDEDEWLTFVAGVKAGEFD
jgi:hypothetical protein